MSRSFLLLFATLSFTFAGADGFQTGSLPAKSLSALAIGPNGILFVGDSLGTQVFALDLGDTESLAGADTYLVTGLEDKVGALIGANPSEVLIHDMAVNPSSKNVYLTASRGRRNWTGPWQLPNHVEAPSLLLRVTPDGKIGEVNLKSVKYASVQVPKGSQSDKVIEWSKAKERVDMITYMAYKSGNLYVAGLSNEEFSSSLWIFPFPFSGASSHSSLEIYHGAHGLYESNAPIRAFIPYEFAGKSELLAAYLCTPLVKIPLDALKDKAHVKGKTIAELGMGNFPLDIISAKENGKDILLMANNRRGLMKFELEKLAAYSQEITQKAGVGEGAPFTRLRDYGILQMSNYSDKFALVMVRQPSGSLDLVPLYLDRLY